MNVPGSLWPAVCVAAGVEWPRDRAAAERFLREVVGQGLISLLFDDDSLPQVIVEARDGFRAMDRINRQRTALLLGAMTRLGSLLEGEEFIVLKGSEYAFRLYPQPHFRQMADVDILVPAERMRSVAEKLRAAGLPQRFDAGVASRFRSHHEIVFDLGPVTVEPHRSFIQTARHRIDYQAIWERRIPFVAGGLRAFRLSDLDAILYCALAIAIKEFSVPMIRYLDLYLMLERNDEDVAILAERAREWRMERALFAALHQTMALLPEITPRAAPLIDRLLTRRTRERLARRVIPPPTGPRSVLSRLPRREQLWRKFQLMDGTTERIAFLFYYCFATAAGAVGAGTWRKSIV